MPEPRYRALRILLRPPEGEVATLLLSLLRKRAAMVFMLGVLLWLASRNPLRTVANCWSCFIAGTLHSGGNVASFAVDTEHSASHPAYFCGGDRKLLRRALAAGQDVVRVTPLRFGRA